MAEFTENLNLEMPDKTEQYNIAVQNSNMEKIDNFSKLTPPRALTADKLTTSKNINGVAFDGTKNVITGLGLYSSEETYNSTNIVYGYVDGEFKIYRSKIDENLGNDLTNEEYWEEVEIAGGSGFNLFDTKISDHILTGNEAKGWALQGTYVSGALYPDFYNKCLEEYQNEQNNKTVIKSNVNIVGSLTNNNGVLSGFNSKSWATLPNNFSPNSSNWEMFFKFTTGTIGTRQNIICSSQLAYQPVDGYIDANGCFVFAGHLNDTATTIFNIKGTTILKSGTTYYVKCEYNSNAGYSLKLGTNKDNLTLEGNSTVTTIINNGYNIALGADFTTNGAYYDYAFSGTIDLSESYINIAGSRFWTGADVVTQNPNGHKFYPIEQKSIADEIYNQYGIADYYGIDEENERVFLPRNKYFHQLTLNTSEVNEMVEAGLPNITGTFKTMVGASGEQPTGAFNMTSSSYAVSSNVTNGQTIDLNASRASSIYGNSDTVQPPSSLKLLYYCVGNTEVTQAITNVTEVTTSENDTIPLFAGMYFDFKPNNVSWLKAGEQQNSAGIYKTCYDTLVEIVKGINNYDLKVINQADMVSGVVYDEYWILDQDNLTFRTPLTISSRTYESIAPVVGNGMTLGLTNGQKNFGMDTANNALTERGVYLIANENGYGTTAGSNPSLGSGGSTSIGVTQDPTKSGIEAHLVENTTAQLYFKVANAVQNLELLDAGEVLEGLTNIIPDNSSLIASYAMPSSKYIDLTLGASDSTYTAPANGYFYVNIKSTGTQKLTYVNIINNNSNINTRDANYHPNTSAAYTVSCVCPAKKGDIVIVSYDVAITIQYSRLSFVYAEGDK